jgi:septal ring factor EnvC (AmiA/AmiB activator)
MALFKDCAAQVEADAEYRQAEVRHLDVKTKKLEAEIRQLNAETRRVDVEAAKLAREVEQPALQTRKAELEIEHLEVGLWSKLLFLGGVIAVLALGAHDPAHFQSSGDELLRSWAWLMSK